MWSNLLSLQYTVGPQLVCDALDLATLLHVDLYHPIIHNNGTVTITDQYGYGCNVITSFCGSAIKSIPYTQAYHMHLE